MNNVISFCILSLLLAATVTATFEGKYQINSNYTVNICKRGDTIHGAFVETPLDYPHGFFRVTNAVNATSATADYWAIRRKGSLSLSLSGTTLTVVLDGNVTRTYTKVGDTPTDKDCLYDAESSSQPRQYQGHYSGSGVDTHSVSFTSNYSICHKTGNQYVANYGMLYLGEQYPGRIVGELIHGVMWGLWYEDSSGEVGQFFFGTFGGTFFEWYFQVSDNPGGVITYTKIPSVEVAIRTVEGREVCEALSFATRLVPSLTQSLIFISLALLFYTICA